MSGRLSGNIEINSACVSINYCLQSYEKTLAVPNINYVLSSIILILYKAFIKNLPPTRSHFSYGGRKTMLKKQVKIGNRTSNIKLLTRSKQFNSHRAKIEKACYFRPHSHLLLFLQNTSCCLFIQLALLKSCLPHPGRQDILRMFVNHLVTIFKGGNLALSTTGQKTNYSKTGRTECP